MRLLLTGENIEGGAYRVIEDELGRELQRSLDELECRMPTPAEVEAPGAIAAADKHQLRYEVAMR